MEAQVKTQYQKKDKIAAIILADQYMGFNIPLSGHREAKIVLPTVFTPDEGEIFKRSISPIIDRVDGNDSVEDYEEPCMIVYMFLTAVNVKNIGTKREVKLAAHPVKISKEKIAYISIPECLKPKEIKEIEQYVDHICEHYFTAE